MDALTLQRLVDGEVSHLERTELLRGLGEDVQSWRNLALALLEEQQWSREIGAMSLSAVPSSSTVPSRIALSQSLDRASVSPTSANESESISTAPSNVLPSTLERTSASHRQPNWHWMSVLAASALFAVGVWGGSSLRSWQRADDGAAADGSELAAAPAKPGNRSGITSNSNMQLVSDKMLRLPSSDSIAHDIPLVDSREIDPELIVTQEAYELARLKHDLKRRGYQIDVQPEWHTGSLGDGRTVVVPIQNVSLRPNGL